MAQSTRAAIRLTRWADFNPPLSSFSSGQRKDQDALPLRWVRLQCGWHRDHDVLDLPPAERAIWPALLSLAGTGSPHGVVALTVRQLAREVDLGVDEVRHALEHLRDRGQIQCSPAVWETGGVVVASATQNGGGGHGSAWLNGGHVPTPPTGRTNKVRRGRAALADKYGEDAAQAVATYVEARAAAGITTERRACGQLARHVMAMRDRGWDQELVLDAVHAYATTKRSPVFFSEWVFETFHGQGDDAHAKQQADERESPLTREAFDALLARARTA